MSQLTEFLFPAPAPRTVGGILAWWEKRRLAYNLFVGSAGLSSLTWIATLSLLPGGRFLHVGWQIWMPVGVFGLMANVCYLLGPTIVLDGARLPEYPAVRRQHRSLGHVRRIALR